MMNTLFADTPLLKMNAQMKADKIAELLDKWNFILLEFKEKEKIVKNSIKSLAWSIAIDQLENCIKDVRDLERNLNSIDKYHKNCINLIKHIEK